MEVPGMVSPASDVGPLAAEWLSRDEAAISPSYTRSYPFVMARGAGSEVWDVDGRRYVDLTAGIAVTATGHSHPRVVRAVQDQAARFLHMSGTDFYYPEQILLGERLAALAPMDAPARVFFANSGAEAIEAALKLARWVTRRPRTLAFLGAFHGRTMGAVSLSASKPVHSLGFSPLLSGVTHIPYPYCYRCPFHLTHPACDLFCLRYVEQEILGHLVPAEEVAAIFVEPIQGEGGTSCPRPIACPRSRRWPGAMACCSWPMRCSRGWGAPGECSRASIGACNPTSWRWPRGWPRACRWARSSPPRD